MHIKRDKYVEICLTKGLKNVQICLTKGWKNIEICLRGPTHQKWSNFAIFGFIVQFDPWVEAHLWKKNYGLGCIGNPPNGGVKGPPSLGKI